MESLSGQTKTLSSGKIKEMNLGESKPNESEYKVVVCYGILRVVITAGVGGGTLSPFHNISTGPCPFQELPQ